MSMNLKNYYRISGMFLTYKDKGERRKDKGTRKEEIGRRLEARVGGLPAIGGAGPKDSGLLRRGDQGSEGEKVRKKLTF
jgi:hypothetical protein